MLERNGVRIAAVSYDSRDILSGFAEKYGIHFPLLSDSGSTAIRSFGIFNVNIAPGLRAYGVPHPVEYLVAPDGIVIRKYFVPNYQHRITASAVALREFGPAIEDSSALTLRSGALTVEIGLSAKEAFAGQEIGFVAKFKLDPGWHVYPSTSVTFDDPRIIAQSFELPEGAVYAGSFQGMGSLLLKFPIDAGRTMLAGSLHFQQCSETLCEPPQTLSFDLPLTIEPFLVATPKK
jgi:hypothetical protein